MWRGHLKFYERLQENKKGIFLSRYIHVSRNSSVHEHYIKRAPRMRKTTKPIFLTKYFCFISQSLPI